MRSIGVVTVGRSDWGIYLPVLRGLESSSALQLLLFVAGAHLLPDHGDTLGQIRQDGFVPADLIRMHVAGDSRDAIAQSVGLGVLGFTQCFQRHRPDLLMVLGDRYEMHAAATAAMLLDIPIAHVHGGEVTIGAFDDALRHSITKLSHLHFVSTTDHGRRVRQLGEEPWRVIVSGAPGLDSVRMFRRLTLNQLEECLDLRFASSPLLVTFHPVTMQLEQIDIQMKALCQALAEYADANRPVIVTRPNADPANQSIVEYWEQFAQRYKSVRLVASLGTDVYFSLMNIAAAMVGNSSSGILEAASFELPVVNIGLRQAGRTRSKNVIDVGDSHAEIASGLKMALNPAFRESLQGMANVYDQGCAASIITGTLEKIEIDQRLRIKKFCDWRESL